MQFICYAKCSTCQKARKWLDAQGVEYTERPIKEENPTAEELKTWHQMSGLPIKKFVNTSGMLYRELQLKDKLPSMTVDEIAFYDEIDCRDLFEGDNPRERIMIFEMV